MKKNNHHMNLESMDIAQEKCEKLKELFPEAFAEGKVDFEQLKRSLGECVDPDKERFGLVWPGKAECMKVIQQPSIATLKPDRDESVNFDDTENLFIEGDNLEVLKLLQKSYFSKVKMIYIDPPYNTGKEFIYPDKYSETLDTYLEYTGQKDSEGRKFSTNTDTGGRYHSIWLNMMYPRLYLAKNLLREDGAIFISIDDHEHSNLKLLCDQVFGEENFVNNIIWQKKYSPSNDAKWLSDNHDFIVCYAKNKTIWRPNLLKRNETALARYKNHDNDLRGVWKTSDLSVKTYSKTYDYSITTPSGRIVNPPLGRCWRIGKDGFEQLVKENRVWFGKNGDNVPAIKKFLTEVKDGITPLTLWTYQEVGHNQTAARELKELFNDSASLLFDTPKPTPLLKKILEIGSNKDSIVMDFFAGSASFAHATFSKNHEDGNNRKCISIQLPEQIKHQNITVADIGKERIRRAAKKIETEQSSKLNLDGDTKLDLGFRVFKLAQSNFKVWDGNVTKIDNLEKQLNMHINHIDAEATQEAILYELLLKSGFPLTTKVEKITLATKEVYSIANEEGRLLICLDKNLTQDVIDAIAEQNPQQVICLDEGFNKNDQLKANAVQTFKARSREEKSEVVFRTV